MSVGLEGVPNYNGRMRQLWKFVMQAVLEEEVRPQLRSWSFRHVGLAEIFDWLRGMAHVQLLMGGREDF